MPFTVTSYLSAIRDAVLNTEDHIRVDAVAGSGKTTAIEWIARDVLPSNAKCLYLVFNRRNAKEATARLPKHVTAQTLNGYGFGLMRSRIRGYIKIDADKVNKHWLFGEAVKISSSSSIDDVWAPAHP